jgi:hypothetical protein
LAASASFNTLVIGCIFLAGALVGAQSYPQIEHILSVQVLNNLVQIVFTVDVIVKLAREGVNPLNYWSLTAFALPKKIAHASSLLL